MNVISTLRGFIQTPPPVSGDLAGMKTETKFTKAANGFGKDGVKLSSEAHQEEVGTNPYSKFSGSSVQAKVGTWKAGQSQSDTTLVGLLGQQGYSQEDLYTDGRPSELLKSVMKANNLKNPNMIMAGSTLTLPGPAKADTAGKDAGDAASHKKVDHDHPHAHDHDQDHGWDRDNNHGTPLESAWGNSVHAGAKILTPYFKNQHGDGQEPLLILDGNGKLLEITYGEDGKANVRTFVKG